ncbi:hypothetical protein WME94_09245 [Sorangium sp. So ce429]
MSRFEALTNSVLDAELEMLRERLGLEPNQKAMPRRTCWRGRTWPSMPRRVERASEATSACGSWGMRFPAAWCSI